MDQVPPFHHIHWHPGRRELRGFAVSMAVGFALLGLLVAWRRHEFGPPTFALWSLGAALAVGALAPGVGRVVYLAVMLPASLVGYAVSHLLLVLIFFLLFVPLGLVLRLMGKDLLRLRRPTGGSQWIGRTEVREPGSYYRQF